MHGYKICLFVQFVTDNLFGTLAEQLAEIGDNSKDASLKSIVFSCTLSSGFLPIPKTSSTSRRPSSVSCAIFSGSSELSQQDLVQKLKTIVGELQAATHHKGVLVIDDFMAIEF